MLHPLRQPQLRHPTTTIGTTGELHPNLLLLLVILLLHLRIQLQAGRHLRRLRLQPAPQTTGIPLLPPPPLLQIRDIRARDLGMLPPTQLLPLLLLRRLRDTRARDLGTNHNKQHSSSSKQLRCNPEPDFFKPILPRNNCRVPWTRRLPQ